MASLWYTMLRALPAIALGLALPRCGTTVRFQEDVPGSSADSALRDTASVEASIALEAGVTTDSGSSPSLPDASTMPDVTLIEGDGGPIDRGSMTSRVELLMFGDAERFDERAPSLVALRALFGGAQLRTFDRAMVPSQVCTTQRFGSCDAAVCTLAHAPPALSSGTIDVTNGTLRVLATPDASGRYGQYAPSSPRPWILEERTIVSATGGPTIPPWAVSIELPGLAPFASRPPSALSRSRPLPLQFRAPSRRAGRRAAMVQTDVGVTLFCPFDEGEPTMIPAEALAILPMGRRVRVTPAAISEALVPAGEERVLVSTIVVTTTSDETLVQ